MAYVTDGLVQYLNAQGQDNANTTWETTTGSNATLTNFALNNTTSGFDGTKLNFDGVDDYITVALNGVYTIEVTLSVHWTASYNYILDGRNGAANSYVSHGDNIGSGWDRWYINGVQKSKNADLITQDTKTHLTFVSLTPLTGTFTFMANGQTKFNNTQGKIYDITAYNRILSDSEIVSNSTSALNDGGTPATVNLSGSIASVSTVSASLNVSKNLASSVSSISSITGGLSVTKSLSGFIAVVSTVNASLTVTGVNNLSGLVTSTSTVTANLSVTKALSGSATGNSNVSSALTVIVVINLSGNINAISSVRGSIQSIINLIGDVGLKSSITASLFVLKTSITYGDIGNIVYKKLNAKTYRYLSAMPFFAPIVSSVNLELIQKYSENLKFITKYSESLKFIEKYTVNLKINSVYSTKMEVSDV